MKASLVPNWSFLAVEPHVLAARKHIPTSFATVASPVASASARRNAFSRIVTEVEGRLIAAGALRISRAQLAVQVFYAMVDLSDHRELPDRDVQRWLNQVIPQTISSRAAVQGSPVTAA